MNFAGAREARTTSWLHRLVARAMGRELTTFVVPGLEVARARGIDVEAAGLGVTHNPRRASVLMVVGELPEGLKEAAAVVYAQMARPRAVLAVGAGEVTSLPGPDVSVESSQEAVAGGVDELRRAFGEGAFAPETTSFEAEVVQDEEEMNHGHMHHGSGEEHEGGQEEDQDSREHEAGSEDEEMDHGSGDGGSAGDEEMDHHSVEEPDEDEGEPALEIPEPVPGEDYMSMVEMTESMPASGDGLVMEWVEAPYGPLFPGLPGGLSLTLTLDGDKVAQTEAEPGIEGWASIEHGVGTVEGFAHRMARMNPLSPVAYRLLALRALEDAAEAYPDEREALARVGALERERAASHLGWLANFGYLIGDGWLSRRAGELQVAILRAANAAEVERLRTGVRRFVRRVERTPLLRSRLGGIGTLSPTGAAEAAGPVARAGGVDADARANEPFYRDLGLAPVLREGDDALARLRVRLEEVEQSLDLLVRAGSLGVSRDPEGAADSGAGTATVETPRGAATLGVTLEAGAVSAVELITPSSRNLALIETLTQGKEVGDALVGVASLDLSPWEVTR